MILTRSLSSAVCGAALPIQGKWIGFWILEDPLAECLQEYLRVGHDLAAMSSHLCVTGPEELDD